MSRRIHQTEDGIAQLVIRSNQMGKGNIENEAKKKKFQLIRKNKKKE